MAAEKQKQISIRLEVALLKKLAAMAKAQNRTRASLIRFVLSQEVDKWHK